MSEQHPLTPAPQQPPVGSPTHPGTPGSVQVPSSRGSVNSRVQSSHSSPSWAEPPGCQAALPHHCLPDPKHEGHRQGLEHALLELQGHQVGAVAQIPPQSLQLCVFIQGQVSKAVWLRSPLGEPSQGIPPVVHSLTACRTRCSRASPGCVPGHVQLRSCMKLVTSGGTCGISLSLRPSLHRFSSLKKGLGSRLSWLVSGSSSSRLRL